MIQAAMWAPATGEQNANCAPGCRNRQHRRWRGGAKSLGGRPAGCANTSPPIRVKAQRLGTATPTELPLDVAVSIGFGCHRNLTDRRVDGKQRVEILCDGWQRNLNLKLLRLMGKTVQLAERQVTRIAIPFLAPQKPKQLFSVGETVTANNQHDR